MNSTCVIVPSASVAFAAKLMFEPVMKLAPFVGAVKDTAGNAFGAPTVPDKLAIVISAPVGFEETKF